MKRIKIAGALVAMIVNLAMAPILPAHAEAAYDTKYDKVVQTYEMMLPAMQKQTDSNLVYRQLHLGLLYHQISSGDILYMYSVPGTYVPVEALTKLYTEGNLNGYCYKIVTGQPLTSVDMAPVFDAAYYYQQNPDLHGAVPNDEVSLFAHFLSNGLKEGRVASKEFNPSIYKTNYPSIKAAYGDNWPMYYHHYLTYGKEGSFTADKLLTN